jgi:integrase
MAKSTLSRRADGRYRKVITDKRTGKKVYFYGKTERELFDKILAYQQKEDEGRTFKEVADVWLQEKWEEISPTTIRAYRAGYKSVTGYFADTPIKEITSRDVMGYLRYLAAHRYAKKTVKNFKSILNGVFDIAVRDGDIKISPSQSVDIPRGLPETKRTSAGADVEKIIIDATNEWIMPFMALTTGLRKGELLALQWKDINFEENYIEVSKSLYYEGGAHIKSTKTEAGIRTVPLLSILKERLLPLRKGPDDYVLGEKPRTPLSNKRVITLSKHYEQNTGVKVELHKLRHSYATIAVRESVPPKILQTVLGHKSISTTMDIYTDVRRESISALGDILNKVYK